MPARRCRVVVRDADGATHAVEVLATSVFEAGALALAEFRREGWLPESLPPATPLEVTVVLPPVQHVVKVAAVERWLRSPARSPSEGLAKRGAARGDVH